jgi:exopolyphosphatase/pppGpp-phosphohydrolase
MFDWLSRSCFKAQRPLWLLAVTLLVAPVARADPYGGIEIGAKGVKATALDVMGGADGYDVKSLMAQTQNTTLVAGLAANGRFDGQVLENTAAAVARFAGLMQKEHKVPVERLYVVGSSGLFSALEGKPDDIKANQQLLADAVKRSCGLTIQFITVEREVELSVTGIVPAKYLDSALLLDVGSGNTKGGYRETGQGHVSMGIPYGSVTFADLIKKRSGKGNYAETAVALRQEILSPSLKKAVENKPGLVKRERIYLSGGASWALANLIRPSDRGSYVALSAEDVDAYCSLLLASPGAFPTPDLSVIVDQAVRLAVEKEIAQVKSVFKPEQLLAGAQILKALADEFRFSKDKTVYFARNAQVGWILAYVAEKSR